MTNERDGEADPNDWLAGQFGEEREESVPPLAASGGAPFQWGLTPGSSNDPEPPAQAPPAAPVRPPAFPAPEPPPTQAFDHRAVQPYQPPPLVGPDVPTAPFSFEATTEALPGHAPPLDSALDGVTEALHAQVVGLPDPEDEGLEASAIDALFGDTQFREYADEGIIAPLPPRASSELVRVERAPKAVRAPIAKTQKVLMWVAGGLIAALALVALFVVGTRVSHFFGPAPAVVVSPSPTPSASALALPLGPVAPGEYQWDQLLGGECLDPFPSAWQDRYTVVECTVPHAAQLVYRGLFSDPADAVYPGIEAVQANINLLCTAPTIIDYAAAAGALDIQVTASFAADEADWNSGNRSYFCFVNRSGGEPLGVSIAVPQVAPAVPVPAVPVVPAP